jgi:hypothetical protein
MQKLDLWTEKDLPLLNTLKKACQDANMNIFSLISDQTIWWLRISPKAVVRNPANQTWAIVPLLIFIFATTLFVLSAYMLEVIFAILLIPIMYLAWQRRKTDKTAFANIYILCPNYLFTFHQELDANGNVGTTKLSFSTRIDRLTGLRELSHELAFYANSLNPTKLYIPSPHRLQLKQQILALRPDDIIDAGK